MREVERAWTHFQKKIGAFIKNPKFAIARLFGRRRGWQESGEGGGLKAKNYMSYGEYLAHQKSKLGLMRKETLLKHDEKYRPALMERLMGNGIAKRGMNVLCLGARTGAEAKSSLDLGCFAVGIDINPGKENKYVLYGDFHKIQFPAQSADIVFTNSLDHALDFGLLMSEIKRVLKPEGRLIIEIADKKEMPCPGYYESAAWESAGDIISLFLKSGFRAESESRFRVPWEGRHFSLAFE
ncbi:MAG: class I SAM-dependent methyltransferase [Candidatus Diapherotrites archaeon]